MALSGSGTLGTFLDMNYSGGGPDFRWKYSWEYDPAADSLSMTYTLQGYSTTAGGSIKFGMQYRVTNTPWATFKCNGTQFEAITAGKSAAHTVSGWQDIFSFTKEVSGTGGTAEISIKNYGQAVWGTTGIGTCDITQTFSISADRGLVRVYKDGAWHSALCYVYNGSAWKQALPYVYNGSGWKLGV